MIRIAQLVVKRNYLAGACRYDAPSITLLVPVETKLVPGLIHQPLFISYASILDSNPGLCKARDTDGEEMGADIHDANHAILTAVLEGDPTTRATNQLIRYRLKSYAFAYDPDRGREDIWLLEFDIPEVNIAIP